MPDSYSPELFWVAVACALTALLWVPHILSLIGQMGLVPALMDGQHETPLVAPWARRAKRAHDNAVANLAVFAPLALSVHVAGLGTALTASVCAAFVLARLAHYVVYALGLPLVRTVLFAVGVGCQLVLASRVLGIV